MAETFELRTYRIAEGRREDLVRRFAEHTVGLLERHGMENIGYWHALGDERTLIYLVRHVGEPKENWASFQADPEWVEARAASLADGPLTESIESVYLETLGALHERSRLGSGEA